MSVEDDFQKWCGRRGLRPTPILGEIWRAATERAVEKCRAIAEGHRENWLATGNVPSAPISDCIAAIKGE